MKTKSHFGFLLLFLLFSALNFHRTTVAQTSVISNGGFESGDLSGWQASGDVSTVTMALDPLTINSIQTVADGTYSAKIGDDVPWGNGDNLSSEMFQEVVIPNASESANVIQFAYAVVANDPPDHPEADKPFFQVIITDLTTNERLYDTNQMFTSQSNSVWYIGENYGGTFGFSDSWVFTDWVEVNQDVRGREGHRIEIRLIVQDCAHGAHAAYAYLDQVNVGTPAQLVLPPMVGTPQQAVYRGPSWYSSIMPFLEKFLITPLLCALCLLPLLLAFGYFLSRRKQPVRSSSYTPPPVPNPEPEPEKRVPEMPGFRPKRNDE
ncbi:MAG TPA: hypothetical protein PK299_05485 [Anaerolineales bacterium]|nr:hypothetical protein [Anaerolineales bacterium]